MRHWRFAVEDFNPFVWSCCSHVLFITKLLRSRRRQRSTRLGRDSSSRTLLYVASLRRAKIWLAPMWFTRQHLASNHSLFIPFCWEQITCVDNIFSQCNSQLDLSTGLMSHTRVRCASTDVNTTVLLSSLLTPSSAIMCCLFQSLS